MTATVWPARLSKDGTRILCGRRDARTGVELCDGELAHWYIVQWVIMPGSGLKEDPPGSGRFVDTAHAGRLYASGDDRAGHPIAMRRDVTQSKRLGNEAGAGGLLIYPPPSWTRKCPKPGCRVWNSVDTALEAMQR